MLFGGHFVWQMRAFAICNRHYEKHVCEIILNLDKYLRYHFIFFLSTALATLLFGGTKSFVHFSIGHYEKQFC